MGKHWTVAAILSIVCFYTAEAQWYNPEKIGAKANAVYNGAIYALRDGQWNTGKTLLLKAIKIEPRLVDAYLSMGGCYGQLKQYDSAVYYYEKAFYLDSVYSNDLLLPYTINLAGLGRFAEAKAFAERLVNNAATNKRTAEAARYRLKQYNFAVDFAAKHSSSLAFDPKNLGDSINSASSEYYPSFTINDSILVFTRRGQGIREDFIKTEKYNGAYKKAYPVPGSLNEEPSKGGINISADGQWLFFAGNFPRKGYGDFDLYISYATDNGWSEALNLGANINTDFWESSPSISPDKQTLYFSSNRPGGFGGKDLYLSRRQPNGKWGKAENMGENFNTAADELAPFIHADNQTLYFTSGGHPGYGGSDIYVSRKGPGGEWSLPENLGYPINTIEDDGSLIVTADGATAFFASSRADSRGGLDLYSFDMPLYARPKRTLWISGQVTDALSKKGLPSAIELKDRTTNQVLENLTTDETGHYLVTLPVGHDYSFTVNRKGYLFYSDNFLLASKPTDSVFRKDIALQPLALNSSLVLKNILYETNSFKLDPSSAVELDKLVKLLTDNPSLRVQINGHTDNIGKPTANLTLSNNRAQSVVNYVVSKGIAASRISFKGFGASKPVADNTSETGRAKNRRTEMVVVGL